jgi:hypothetical protein
MVLHLARILPGDPNRGQGQEQAEILPEYYQYVLQSEQTKETDNRGSRYG